MRGAERTERTPKIAITDLGITVDGNLGFSHSIQHVMGTDKEGHPIDRTVRVTDGYRKVGGDWAGSAPTALPAAVSSAPPAAISASSQGWMNS